MNSKEDNTIMTCLGAISYLTVITIIGAILSGWVTTKLWGWFVMPIFDIRQITIAEAIGLTLFFGLFTSRKTDDTDTKDKSWLEVLILGSAPVILTPLLFLAIAWIVTLFM